MLGPNQRKFIDALRSGKYKQCRSRLCRQGAANEIDNGYCCLGVACEEMIPTHKHIDAHHNVSYMGHVHDLPPLVIQMLGLRNEVGSASDCNMASMMNMNDSLCYSFNMIADKLEEYSDKYFKESC